MGELVQCQMFVVVSQDGQEKIAEHVSNKITYDACMHIHCRFMMNHDIIYCIKPTYVTSKLVCYGLLLSLFCF